MYCYLPKVVYNDVLYCAHCAVQVLFVGNTTGAQYSKDESGVIGSGGCILTLKHPYNSITVVV